MSKFRIAGAIALGSTIAQPLAAAPALTNAAHASFASQQLKGALFSEDVLTGRTLADFDTGGGALDLPLSPVKLLLTASYFEHQRELRGSIRADIDSIIAHGSDDAGRKLALDLRKSLGSAALLHDLARFGFPACGRARPTNCTTLSATTPDAEWADALSLGERDFRITAAGLSHFLRIVGLALQARHGTALSGPSAMRLKQAMLETVETGTARGSAEPLAGLGAMGGKTGSTAINGADPFDGLFAGLIFDARGRPRYTIVTFVRRHGVGGGVAAHLSGTFAATALKR